MGDKLTTEIKKPSGQTARLEHFVDTLQEQDDTMFLMRKVAKWPCLFASVLACVIPAGSAQAKGLELSTVLMGMNAFFVGMLSMLFSLDFPVAMRRGAVFNLYETLKFFPVGRLEIYMFLRKRLLRYLSLYGGLTFSLRLIAGAMTDSLKPESLVFPFIVWLVLALVGCFVIRVGMAWRYRKQVRSL